MKDPRLHLITAFKLTSSLVHGTLEGFTDDQARRKLHDDVNCAAFVIGHLAATRASAIALLGGKKTEYFGGICDRGAAPVDPAEYPSLGESLAIFDELGRQMYELIKTIPTETLESESAYKFPLDDPSLRAGINFLALHEMYHIGQLAIFRKALLGSGPVG